MIGHVASAGESRGRVVLRLGCGAGAIDAAFEAAAEIALAFDSEIEGLFVEDRQLLDLTGYPFAREIPLAGGGPRPLSISEMEREMRSALLAARHRLARLTRRTRARTFCTAVRDDPVSALAQACSRAGPWNVVVIGEPFTGGDGPRLKEILATVRDATGLVTVPRRARIRPGPIVIATEDPERLPSMLRTAQRLAANASPRRRVVVLLVTENPHYRDWAEGQLRLMLAHETETDFRMAPPCFGEPAVPVEAIRRLGAGFVIAQFGGLTVPEGDLRPLAGTLDCPLFLVR